MNNYLPTDYQSFIATSRYARWLDTENRRENWGETVQRFIDNVIHGKVDPRTEDDIRSAILNLEVMPSMRSIMTAGPALLRDNTAGYNCAYMPVDDTKSFDEAMFILLCGTGVGFSVERQYINKLPEIPELLFVSDDVITVHDSKEGWAKALRKLIALLYAGEIPTWDVSKVRPAGAKLKTFGGRASGPAPLVELFKYTIAKFNDAKGRRLSSIEVHDIMCKIGEVVVVGGVRRSAMISLSNLSDDRMRNAKSGMWWEHQGQRALANNSVAYTEQPDMETFMREWLSLVESKSGERGIFSRPASRKQAAKSGRRDTGFEFGTNPCSEIILRPDNAGLIKTLEYLKQVSVATNVEWADKLGIPHSTATTTVKPSGTVSQLCDSASGIHARHSQHYVRTVRGDNKDPLTQFMVDQGIPSEPCVMKPDSTTVFSFPQKSPEGAVTRNDMSAIEQLDFILTYQRHWTEHKVSCTVTVKDSEWMEVGAYVYKHFDEMSGVSFLPHSDHSYQQAPYQDCTRHEYDMLLSVMPERIDWARLSEYETEDTSKGTSTFACSGSTCEIVDLT